MVIKKDQVKNLVYINKVGCYFDVENPQGVDVKDLRYTFMKAGV